MRRFLSHYRWYRGAGASVWEALPMAWVIVRG